MADQSADIKTYLAALEADTAIGIAMIAKIRRDHQMEPWSGVAATPVQAQAVGVRDNVGAPGQVRPDEFFRMTIPDAIVKLLGIHRKPQPSRSIVDGLRDGGMLSNAKNFASNVWTAINRMQASGVMVNTPTGWGLADWYPGRPPKTPLEPLAKRAAKKVAKAPAKKATPKTVKREAASAKLGSQRGNYPAFMRERRAAGRSLIEANADWKAQKEG